MAATRAKTSGRKKTVPKKKTATRGSTRKKTAGKAAAGRSKADSKQKPAIKTVTRKKTDAKQSGRKKTGTPRRASATPGTSGETAFTLSHVEQIAPYKVKRGEPYMNENQRQHFHDLLIAWKRDLMEEADRTVHYMRDEASNFPDPNDRASQESEFSLELRTRDRERKLLRKIDQALKRLEMDDYGWCEACGAEIGIRRLEARPTATLCFDCKTLDEIRERQKGL